MSTSEVKDTNEKNTNGKNTNIENTNISNEELVQIKMNFLEAIKCDNVEIISKYYHLKLIPEVKLIIYSVIQNLNNIFDYCLSENIELAHQVLNDDTGYRLLEYVCQYGRIEMLTTLISCYQTDINKVNVKSINQYTYLPINICIYEKHNHLIKYLLEHNVDCSIGQNITGNTPLHICVLSNNHIALDMILQNGIDANLQNKGGNTPLHLATYINDLESVKILIRYGVNINSKNFNYNTPFDFALLEDNYDIITLMKEHNAKGSYGNSIELILSI